MIDKMSYVHQATLVKVQEKKLLNIARLNRMIEASSQEILKILNETNYSKSMVGINDITEYEQILEKEMENVFKFANELCSKDPIIIQILKLKNDFQDFKTRVKEGIKNGKDITNDLDEKYHTYYNEIIKLYEKDNDIQKAMILIDRQYFEKFKELVSIVDVELLNRYYKLSLDQYNILTFLRLKNQGRTYKYASFCLIDDEDLLRLYESSSNYIPVLEKKYDNKKMWQAYEKTGKLATLEKMMENSIVDLIREYKQVLFGVEPIVTYVLAKEFETKAIRLIMTAKINKIPTEIIKERMRGIYV